MMGGGMQYLSMAGAVFSGGGNAGALFPVDDAADFANGARYIPGEVTDARRQGRRVVFDPDEHRWHLPDGRQVPVVSQYRAGGVVFPAEYCAVDAAGQVTAQPCALNVTTGALAGLLTANPSRQRAYVVYAGQEFEVAHHKDGAACVPDYKHLLQVAQRALSQAQSLDEE